MPVPQFRKTRVCHSSDGQPDLAFRDLDETGRANSLNADSLSNPVYKGPPAIEAQAGQRG